MFLSRELYATAMELPVKPSLAPSRGRNLEAPPWCYLLWGVPALLIVGSFEARTFSLLSLTEAGAIWVAAVAWAGIGCFLNARSCGRVHCKIDGIGFPLLAFVGALNVAMIISFDWNWFWIAFAILLIASFVPEITWKKYS